VSWDDATAYADWLSRKTGKTYRLPTEAEWEYAARAGTKTPFWFGSSISTTQANYDGTYPIEGGRAYTATYRKKTMSVDSFEPNPWGLYNVHGNVWEWVQDCSTYPTHHTYKGAPMDGSAWTTGDCIYHVLRGGSWEDAAGYLRSAFRNMGWGSSMSEFELDTTGGRTYTAGFRLARTL
jgi:formylglycine-generating enzyme required for sulfatase activity